MATDNPYTGPERRADDLEQVATYIRAKRLVDDNDRKQTRKNALIAVTAASLVGIVVGIAMGFYFKDNARINARRTCHVQREGGITGNGRAFAQRQILIVADEAFQQFPERFRNVELARINRELRKVRHRLAPNAPQIVDDFTDLNAMLPIQPPLDCGKLIK